MPFKIVRNDITRVKADVIVNTANPNPICVSGTDLAIYEAVYSSIEHIYGYDYVTSCYKDSPQDSWKQIVDYMHEMYPEATDKQIRKLLK